MDNDQANEMLDLLDSIRSELAEINLKLDNVADLRTVESRLDDVISYLGSIDDNTR